jgi:hypothetical protein
LILWLLNLLQENAAILVVAGTVLFISIRWIIQRRDELAQRRREQYWELIDTITGKDSEPSGSIHALRQVVAIHLLAKYPEFSDVTLSAIEYFENSRADSKWWITYADQFEDLKRKIGKNNAK